MKIIKLFAIIYSISIGNLFSQIDTTIWYPLQNGNQWQYLYSYSITEPSHLLTVKVIGKTTLANGKVYSVLSFNGSKSYQRMENQSLLFEYSPSSNQEYLRFDFQAPDKSIWPLDSTSNHYGVYMTKPNYVRLIEDTLLAKTYNDVYIDTSGPIPDTSWGTFVDGFAVTITKGLGVTSNGAGIGTERFISAIIDGDTLGNVVETKPEYNSNAYYPLHIGDKWYYKVNRLDCWVTGPYSSYNFVVTVTKDTVIENKLYYQIEETRSDSNLIKMKYIRIDSLKTKVYEYRKVENESTEILIEDLSLEIGESFNTWNVYGDNFIEQENVTFIKKSTLKIFDNVSETYNSNYYSTDTTDSFQRISYYLSEGIGRSNYFIEVFEWYTEIHRLKAAYIDGVIYGDSTLVGVNKRINSLPSGYALEQNYPNPFNPSTTLSYSIPNQGMVELKIYDVLGREVATLVSKEQQAGSYEVQFDASRLTSGIYFYQLSSEGYVESKKMVLLK